MSMCVICNKECHDEYCYDCLRAITIYALQTGQSTDDVKQTARALKA